MGSDFGLLDITQVSTRIPGNFKSCVFYPFEQFLIVPGNPFSVRIKESPPRIGISSISRFPRRVFYVEGQSLVFYAYDLAANHPERKVVFHVWGETAGVKETTHSMGILHSDNPSQARWVLTFDDPKILKRINAVYITAEHGTPPKDDPQGRKLLYAFLGSPNHS